MSLPPKEGPKIPPIAPGTVDRPISKPAAPPDLEAVRLAGGINQALDSQSTVDPDSLISGVADSTATRVDTGSTKSPTSGDEEFLKNGDILNYNPFNRLDRGFQDLQQFDRKHRQLIEEMTSRGEPIDPAFEERQNLIRAQFVAALEVARKEAPSPLIESDQIPSRFDSIRFDLIGGNWFIKGDMREVATAILRYSGDQIRFEPNSGPEGGIKVVGQNPGDVADMAGDLARLTLLSKE